MRRHPRDRPDQRASVLDLAVSALVTWSGAMHLLARDPARSASRVTLPLGLSLAAAPAFLRHASDPDTWSAGVNHLVTWAGSALALAPSTARD